MTFKIGDNVRVNIAGKIVGRSEFLIGDDTFLVEYERKGKTQKEWIVADKLVPDDVAEGGGI